MLRPPGRQLARVIALTSAPATRTLTAGRLVQPGQKVEQGGLARARWPHQRGERTLGDVEREAGEDLDALGIALEDFVDVTDFD